MSKNPIIFFADISASGKKKYNFTVETSKIDFDTKEIYCYADDLKKAGLTNEEIDDLYYYSNQPDYGYPEYCFNYAELHQYITIYDDRHMENNLIYEGFLTFDTKDEVSDDDKIKNDSLITIDDNNTMKIQLIW